MSISKINGVLYKLLSYITAAMSFGMVAIVFWQVIARYIVQSSSGWTQEVTLVLFMWVTMLGSAMAVRSAGHVSMTLLVNNLKGYAKPIVKMIALVICEAFYVMLAVSGYAVSMRFLHAGTTQLKIPMPVVYSSFVVGGIVMSIFALELMWNELKEIARIKRDKNNGTGGAAL